MSASTVPHLRDAVRSLVGAPSAADAAAIAGFQRLADSCLAGLLSLYRHAALDGTLTAQLADRVFAAQAPAVTAALDLMAAAPPSGAGVRWEAYGLPPVVVYLCRERPALAKVRYDPNATLRPSVTITFIDSGSDWDEL